jgi:hypothetical protein
MRRLIFETFPSLKSQFNLSEWRLFDLVTEINDDVADVFEDLHTINGNRFLISASIFGKDYVRKEFLSFLEKIQSRNQVLPKRSKAWSTRIQKLTFENIISTKQLIDVHLEKISENQLKELTLFNLLRK